MTEAPIFRTRLRPKGQITVPTEIRSRLEAEEGDELVFWIDEHGRVVIECARVIPPDQAWFWNERWQRLERQVQQDIEAGKTHRFDSAENALGFLHQAAGDGDAED